MVQNMQSNFTRVPRAKGINEKAMGTRVCRWGRFRPPPTIPYNQKIEIAYPALHYERKDEK